MQSGLLNWQKWIERVQPITSLAIESMRWQNPVSRASAIHVYPRVAAAAAAASIHVYPRATAAAAASIHVYPRAAAAAPAAAIALKFHPKHDTNQKQNETHYENITH